MPQRHARFILILFFIKKQKVYFLMKIGISSKFKQTTCHCDRLFFDNRLPDGGKKLLFFVYGLQKRLFFLFKLTTSFVISRGGCRKMMIS